MENKIEQLIEFIKVLVTIIGASLGLGLALSGFFSLFFNFTENELMNLIKTLSFLFFVIISHTILKKKMLKIV